MHDLVTTKKESLNHIYPFAWVPTLGWSRLPRRKLRKIGLRLNLCPSHTEIFSKRRKIYSWLCERLELMWQPLKNGPASRALGNAFDLDLEFHWANDREIEARWGRTLVEDNCNNLALAKVAGIARMPYNPLVFQCKKHLGRSQRHLLFILRHGLGRQSKKIRVANSTQCSQAVTHPSTD